MSDWLTNNNPKRRFAYRLINRWMAQKGDIESLPDWSPIDSRKRDRWMLHNWPSIESIMAGAMNRMIEALAAKGWVLVGPKRVVRHHRQVLIGFQGLNKGSDSWNSGTAKQMAIHYLASDLGPKYIGFHDASGLLVGLALLDPSLLHFATINGETNWWYTHPARNNSFALNGKRFTAMLGGQEVQVTGKVSGFVSVPPSMTAHNEIGRCAFSLVIDFAKLLVCLFEHWGNSLDDRPAPGVAIWKGIDEEHLSLSIKSYLADLKAMRREKGRKRPPSLPIFDEDLQGIDVLLRSFSEAPSSLDPEKLIDLYFWYISACLDVNESFLRTVNTGSFGNAAQVTIQQEVTERTGERAMISQFVESLSKNHLPDTIEAMPDDRDALTEKARLEAIALFMDAHERMISANLISAEEARALAVQQGLLPSEFADDDQNVSSTDSLAARYRDDLLSLATVRRAAELHPNEPIIWTRFSPQLGSSTERALIYNPEELLKRKSFKVEKINA